MQFGILFTSHANAATEPYPHRAMHARVTAEIQRADALGYDTAWVAEHHFSNSYGIMPDVFAYMSYLAAKTTRIKLGAAVVTLPLYDPVRVVENTSFIDILSEGRVVLGLGSGYRPYEFTGFGKEFEERRDMQEEAIRLILTLLHERRGTHEGKYYKSHIGPDNEIYPHSVQQPHPPLYMAAATDRSIAYAAENGFGLMLSTLSEVPALKTAIRFYRDRMPKAPAPLNTNPAFGQVDVARWMYVAETDAQARKDSEEGIVRHLSHFLGKGTAGYLGTVSEKDKDKGLSYDELVRTTILHGSPETLRAKLRELRDTTGMNSVVVHYPPYYGTEKAMQSLTLFAEKVMPEFQKPARRAAE